MSNNTAHAARSLLEIAAETTWATLPVSLDVVPFISNGIEHSGDLQPREIINGGPLPFAPYKANRINQGDIVVPWDATHIQKWLTLLFGSPTATTWEFDSMQTSFAVVRQYPDITHKEEFLGCLASKFSINWKQGGELTATIGVVSAKRAFAASDSLTEPAMALPFDSFELTITKGGSGYAKATEINLDVDFALDSSIYAINGAGLLAGIPQGVAKITGSITALFDNDDLEDAKETEEALVLTLTSTASGTWVITLPKIQHSGPAISVAGPAGIMQKINYIGYTDDPANFAVQFAYTAPV